MTPIKHAMTLHQLIETLKTHLERSPEDATAPVLVAHYVGHDLYKIVFTDIEDMTEEGNARQTIAPKLLVAALDDNEDEEEDEPPMTDDELRKIKPQGTA